MRSSTMLLGYRLAILLAAIPLIFSKANCQTAARIDGIGESVDWIGRMGDSIWAYSTEGAWRITGDVAIRTPDKPLLVYGIQETKNAAWLLSEAGVQKFDGQLSDPILPPDIEVFDVEQEGLDIWLATHQGAYRIRGRTIERIPDLSMSVHSILRVRDRIWLAGDKGAWVVTGDSVDRIPDVPLEVIAIEEVDQFTWVHSKEGAWRVEGAGARRFPDEPIEIKDIVSAAHSIWIIGTTGCWRVAGDVATKVPDEDLYIYNVVETPTCTWILSLEGAWRVDSQGVRRIPNRPIDAYAVWNYLGDWWIASSEGAWRAGTSTGECITSSGEAVRFIRQVGDRVWIGTDMALWSVTGNLVERVPRAPCFIHQMKGGEQSLWVATSRGAGRITPKGFTWLTDDSYDFHSIHITPAGVLFRGDKGVHIVTGERASPLFEVERFIHQVEIVGSRVLLASLDGVWIIDGEAVRPINSNLAGVERIDNVDGRVFVRTSLGVWEISTDRRLTAEFPLQGGGWRRMLDSLLPPKWKLSGKRTIQIKQTGREASGGTKDSFVEAEAYVVDGSGSKSPIQGLSPPWGGPYSIRLTLVDSDGNQAEVTDHWWMIPTPAPIAGISIVFAVALVWRRKFLRTDQGTDGMT